MMLWWNARSTREKVLLGVAAALLFVVLVWLGMLKPAISTLEAAKTRHAHAAQTSARMDRIALLIEQGEQISPAMTRPATQGMPALQTQIIAFAEENGLTVDAFNAPDAAVATINVSGAPSPALFKWIEQVETGLGITVSAASLQQSTDGNISASVEFTREGNP